MNARTLQSAYGTLTEPATLTVQRRLPGPIERVWAYLTESDLRRQWLAAGDMPMEVGAKVELVWRNDELTDPPGQRPEGFPNEHRMSCRITELDPPHRLAITWGSTGGVSFVLAEDGDGDGVLLSVTHRRVDERSTLLNVSTGWQMHLDVLVARLTGQQPAAVLGSLDRPQARVRAAHARLIADSAPAPTTPGTPATSTTGKPAYNSGSALSQGVSP